MYYFTLTVSVEKTGERPRLKPPGSAHRIQRESDKISALNGTIYKEFSHCVRKSPFQPLAVAGMAGETPAVVAGDEPAVARLALAQIRQPWLYARVDLLRGESGEPLIIELELIEPSLFFAMGEGAVSRMADALARLARQHPFSSKR